MAKPQRNRPTPSSFRSWSRSTFVAISTITFVIVWSLNELGRVRSERERAGGIQVSNESKQLLQEGSHLTSVEDMHASAYAEMPDLQEDVRSVETSTADPAPLLGAVFTQETRTQERYFRELHKYTDGGHVSVINIWATYCKPCKKEFEMFRDLSQRDDWGREVRFIPILINVDAIDEARSIRETMPASSAFLIDEGQTSKALAAGGMVPSGDLTLPITLIIDCKKNLHYVHPGAVLNQEIEVFRETLESVRGELDSCQSGRTIESKPYVGEPMLTMEPQVPSPTKYVPKTSPRCGRNERLVANLCIPKDADPFQ